MAEHIHTYAAPVTGSDDVRYRVHAHGERTPTGSWNGWLVFEPEGSGGAVLRTDRETTQQEREDLVYWASGLEPIYLDGALGRATRRPG